MYLNIRLKADKDVDIIADIERYKGKDFTQTDRVKELIRFGQLYEQRHPVLARTGRAMDAPNVTHNPPRPFISKEVKR